MLDKIKNKLRFIKNQYIYNKEVKFFDNMSDVMSFERVINNKKDSIKSICFIVPDMIAYSGGHTSILRLGTELSKLGYDIRYITYRDMSNEEMVKNASINLKAYKGEMYTKDYLYTLENDVVVATLWESAYFVSKMQGYKMYFVQDYEPYFFNYGEKFLLAKNSYNLGLHMVSLGSWNKYMIEKECSEKCDSIDFPYEKSEYKIVKRDFVAYANKNNFKIAVYIKQDGKRAPFIIQSMLSKLEEDLKLKGISLDIYYFGDEKKIKFKNGTNLGKLNKDELLSLYEKCDFGMVASLTNISLVPYEMIATNLPIIEFKDGTFNHFFDENSAILTTFNYRDLTNKIYKLIQNPNLIELMCNNAYSQIDNLSWEKSAKQFRDIMLDI